MPIILKNSIFYHIPKTGGSWVGKMLRETSDVSTEYSDKKNMFNLTKGHETPKIWPPEGKKSFAFVRKPESWYWSFWNYRMDNNWDEDFILDRKCKDTEFNNFVEKVLTEFPDGFVSAMYKEFVGEDAKGIDRIGKQENLREDLISILKEYDEVCDENFIREEEKFNQSSASDKEIDISEELLSRLRTAESWAYDKFYRR